MCENCDKYLAALKEKEIDHLVDCNQRYADLMREVDRLRTALAERDDRIKELDDEIAFLTSELTRLNGDYKAECAATQDRIKELELELDEMIISPVTPLIDKAAEFLGTPDDLKSIACIDVALNHANTLRQELQAERAEIAALTAETEVWREKKAILENDLGAAYRKIDKLETEMSDYKTNSVAQVIKLQKRIEELESEVDKAYCPTCGACGEDGCCPPDICKHLKCFYGEDYAKTYRELEAENDAMGNRIKELEDMWSGVQSMSTCTVEYDNDLIRANKRIKELEELVDGATEAVEIFQAGGDAAQYWKEMWLKKAKEALKGEA